MLGLSELILHSDSISCLFLIWSPHRGEHTLACMHECAHSRTDTCTLAHTHTHTHNTHTYTHKYTHAHTHTHTYTHTHTHTHTGWVAGHALSWERSSLTTSTCQRSSPTTAGALHCSKNSKEEWAFCCGRWIRKTRPLSAVVQTKISVQGALLLYLPLS
jgi:hypothetical protein